MKRLILEIVEHCGNRRKCTETAFSLSLSLLFLPTMFSKVFSESLKGRIKDKALDKCNEMFQSGKKNKQPFYIEYYLPDYQKLSRFHRNRTSNWLKQMLESTRSCVIFKV